MLPGPVDVVPDDQEVVDVAHLLDDGELIVEALPNRAVVLRIALCKSLVAEVIQIGPGIVPLRHVEVRELGLPEFDRDIAAVRDLLGVVQSLLGIGEELPHLLLALYVELSAGIPHPVLIADLPAGLDAQKAVVGLCILCEGVVAVVRRNEGDPEVLVHL